MVYGFCGCRIDRLMLCMKHGILVRENLLSFVGMFEGVAW